MPEIAFQYHTPKKMIGTFVVDAFLAERYRFSNSVTDIPVEEGSNINDHIVEDHDVISVNILKNGQTRINLYCFWLKILPAYYTLLRQKALKKQCRKPGIALFSSWRPCFGYSAYCYFTVLQ
jgi:hypothetical protein